MMLITKSKQHRLVSPIQAPNDIRRRYCDRVGYVVYEAPSRVRKILSACFPQLGGTRIVEEEPFVVCYGALFQQQEKVKWNWFMDILHARQHIVCKPSYNKGTSIYCDFQKFAFADGKSQLDYQCFSKWMELCKEHHLLTPQAEYYRDGDKNVMKIPFLLNYHLLYTSLCVYRLSDACSDMVWQIVHTLEENPDLHFWQAVQYYVVDDVTSIFLSFSSWDKDKNFRHALAIERFLVQKSQCSDYKNKLTQECVFEEGFQFDWMLLPENDSILNTKWAALYEMADQPVEEIKRVYDELVKA